MKIKYQNHGDVTSEEFELLANSFKGEHPRPRYLNQKALDGSWFVGSARDNNKLVGIIRLIGDGAYVVHVADLFVHPEYQGQGIGGALVGLAIEYAKEMKVGTGTDYGEFTLFSTKEGSGFYQKSGFVLVPNGMCFADHPCRKSAEDTIRHDFENRI